ncbi:MAG: hypothetical protein WD993_09185, partial [Thermoleophilaceae bacterium]
YAAALRSGRYKPRPGAAPDLRARRALRRELGARGVRARLRSVIALPPGGPTPIRGGGRRPRRCWITTRFP